MHLRTGFVLVLLLAGVSAATPCSATAAEPGRRGVEFFEKKIRPVLVEHCYRCHSAEARKSRGGLQLDSAAGLLKGGDSGPALVPGNPGKSLVLKALRHDGGLKMPSEEKKLPEAVLADFEAWIAMGAPDPRQAKPVAGKAIDFAAARRFWAFQRPVLHAAPKVKDADRVTNEIDAFLLAELEKRGLRPLPDAGKRELIRRATFDLIGLPPTPEEVAEFERDDSPNAFARVVERLLASPHYGERWGRYWLDVSRYADDKALAFPTPWPHAYRYRDWVVRAFNEKMPYDRFLRLQLAGDLVPGEETDGGDLMQRLVGLGFQGLGAEYHKGSVPAQVMADELDDRIDTLTRGLLGLTVACARCHDHKFDPIPTRDYYSLAAAYNGATWNVLTISPPAEVSRYQAWQKDGKEIEARIGRWTDQQKAAILEPELRATGRYLLAAWRLRGLNKRGGTTPVADFARQEKLEARFLGRWVAWIDAMKSKAAPGPLADWLKAAEEAEAGARLDRGGQIAVPEQLQQATTALQRAVSAALEEKERLEKASRSGDASKKQPAKPTPQNEALLRALTQGNTSPFFIPPAGLPGFLSPVARQQLDAMQAELQRHRQSAPPAPLLAHGVSGGGNAMRIALRGNVERPGELAPPGFLQILEREPSAPRTRFTRLDLAEAICSPDNPLTARVIVNRVWQHHFGRGLVATASNFGHLGERPTHPELLDTLAVRFVQSGWSLEWLHRELMLSSAYRLSSQHDARNAGVDPDNSYLWRYTPRRLDIEAWRDAILTVSGRLDPTFAGPPGNLAEPNNARRTIYGKVSRLEPDKMLVAFDFPDANVSSERRSVTVVPQQQLFVLNSDFMIASAKSLAQRLEKAAHKPEAPAREAAVTDEERIDLAHRWAFGRPATAAEIRLAIEFLRASSGDRADGLTAWEQYAQAILASNEFVWID
jgi:hypothetical protein